MKKIILLFYVLFSCQSKVESSITDNSQITKVVTMKHSSPFVGNYSGTNNQKEIFISLSSVPRTNKIIGILILDRKQAQIATTETNAVCTGAVTEEDTQKKYTIVLKIIDKKLHCDIVFPEYNNQVLALVLERSTLTLNNGDGNTTIDNEEGTVITSGSNSGSSTKPLIRDRALVGTWRFTEVISSGSGQFYSSFSTDYFIQLLENGSCITWTGKGAGGSANASLNYNKSNTVQSSLWHTDGKNVVFVNPNNNRKISIPYYAEENRMILKGNLNRVYNKIN